MSKSLAIGLGLGVVLALSAGESFARHGGRTGTHTGAPPSWRSPWGISTAALGAEAGWTRGGPLHR